MNHMVTFHNTKFSINAFLTLSFGADADSKFNYKYQLCVEGIKKLMETYASGILSS